jgi:hypothetical protein
MTIGIAVTGEGAGLAAFRALEAIERVARGAIGGFVSFVVISRDNTLLRAETQRGGTCTLFVEGERTGASPPPAIAAARFAALMSSGPDRPTPLARFTPGDAAHGLVTGHRLPNMPGDGADRPLNEAVLARLASGADPRQAVEAELADHPEADAGLIALDRHGRLYAQNSAFVKARGDLGSACLADDRRGHRVAVLHNAIHPISGLAALAAGVAMDCMAPPDRADFELRLEAGTAIRLGEEDALHIDTAERLVGISVSNAAWLRPRRDGAVVNFATKVLCGDRLVGHTTNEPYCVTESGRLVSMSGQTSVAIGVRRAD